MASLCELLTQQQSILNDVLVAVQNIGSDNTTLVEAINDLAECICCPDSADCTLDWTVETAEFVHVTNTSGLDTLFGPGAGLTWSNSPTSGSNVNYEDPVNGVQAILNAAGFAVTVTVDPLTTLPQTFTFSGIPADHTFSFVNGTVEVFAVCP